MRMLSDILAGSWCIAWRLSALALWVRPVPVTRHRAGSGWPKGGSSHQSDCRRYTGSYGTVSLDTRAAERLRQRARFGQRLLRQRIYGIAPVQQTEVIAIDKGDTALA